LTESQDFEELFDDLCSACKSGCSHPKVPLTVAVRVNRSKELSGTVKPYAKHLFLCTGKTDWPKKPDKEEGSPLTLLSQAVKNAAKAASKEQSGFLITECDLAPVTSDSGEPTPDILLMPDRVHYSHVTPGLYPNLAAHLMTGAPLDPIITRVEPTHKHYVFLCAHKTRDKRCGVYGELLFNQFTDSLGERHMLDEVALSRCSHTGGHKFAGNAIVYPSGYWFGRLKPCHVDAVIDRHIKLGQLLPSIMRGQISTEW